MNKSDKDTKSKKYKLKFLNLQPAKLQIRGEAPNLKIQDVVMYCLLQLFHTSGDITS
jgi:hypothetical protein